jgi:hypothetical protein
MDASFLCRSSLSSELITSLPSHIYIRTHTFVHSFIAFMFISHFFDPLLCDAMIIHAHIFPFASHFVFSSWSFASLCITKRSGITLC